MNEIKPTLTGTSASEGRESERGKSKSERLSLKSKV
jgi:hypothetical protein